MIEQRMPRVLLLVLSAYPDCGWHDAAWHCGSSAGYGCTNGAGSSPTTGCGSHTGDHCASNHHRPAVALRMATVVTVATMLAVRTTEPA